MAPARSSTKKVSNFKPKPKQKQPQREEDSWIQDEEPEWI
jgi:hypothetical protein